MSNRPADPPADGGAALHTIAAPSNDRRAAAPPPRWTSIVFPLIAVAACGAAFWPNIPGGRFLSWDDDRNILDNYSFRGLSPTHLQWMWTTGKMGHYQPLSWTSLGLDYVLWGMTGPDFPEAARFRLTNLVLHALGAAAFYFLALRLLRIGTGPGIGTSAGVAAIEPPAGGRPATPRGMSEFKLALAALFATLLYAIHPMRCESVCWVTERRDVLSGLFFILALLAYLRANPPMARMQFRTGWLAVAVAAAGAAVLLFLAAVDRSDKFNLHGSALGAPGFVLLLAAAAASAVAASRAFVCPEAPRRAAWMLAAFGFLVASLFAKAWGMVMPVLFLLLDYWPLRQFEIGLTQAGGAVARGDKSGRRGRDADRASRRAATGADAAGAGGAGVAARHSGHGGPPYDARAQVAAGRPDATRSGLRAAAVLLAEKAPYFALSVIFAVLARWAQAGQLDTLKTLAEHPISARIAQAFYGLAFYPFKTLWPAALSPIYQLPQRMSPFEPRYLLPALAVIALTAALFALRRRWPAAWVAWLCYGVIVSPVLGIQQSGPQLVAARYAYLSCMPFAILAGGVLLAAVRRWDAATPALAPVAFAACAALGVSTFRLSGAWRDSERLWSHAARVQPDSPLVCMNLGVERKRQAAAEQDRARREELFDESIALYQRAIELQPENGTIYTNLANLYSLMSDELPARRDALMADAIESSAKALELANARNVLIAEMRLNHGVILFKAGRMKEALREFDWFVRTKPEHAVGRNNLATILMQLGRADEAIPHLEAAVRSEPSYVKAWRNLGDACRMAGQRDRAIEAFRECLKHSPNDAYSKAKLKELGG